jgi:hypothetical protein
MLQFMKKSSLDMGSVRYLQVCFQAFGGLVGHLDACLQDGCRELWLISVDLVLEAVSTSIYMNDRDGIGYGYSPNSSLVGQDFLVAGEHFEDFLFDFGDLFLVAGRFHD